MKEYIKDEPKERAMRLIDADALTYEILSEYGADGGTEEVNTIYGMVINAPTIDAEQVKHGEWIDHGTTCQRYECSVCGDQHDWLILPNNINFCPNCGAKMNVGE